MIRRRLDRTIGTLIGGLFALLLLSVPALAAPKFPALTGRVVDEAQVLPPPTEAQLTDKLAQLEAKTGRQLVVVTLPSLQGYEIADYGYQLGRAWGIGRSTAPGEAAGTEKDNGVLFIVAPSERSVRIEVGYGLEPILTDALSSVILQTQVLPRFKSGDMSGGIVAGTDALITQLALPPDQAAARVRQVSDRAERASQSGDFFGRLMPILVILIILFGMFRGGRGRRGGMGWIAPIILGGLSSRGRDGGGGFGGGGGGFSGGGGSFGGGGASGRW
jgi:uncharacterized protein